MNLRDRMRTTRAAADVRAGKRDWFRFENQAADQAEIYVYDEISWFGINAADFLRELRDVTAKSIALHINSPGGDVFDGIAIYNGLKGHPSTVNVVVDGIAASIASVIAMAGDTITMAQGSMMMIHEPFGIVIGDARDLRRQADALDVMGDNIAGIYASRAGGEPAAWRALMEAETWYGDQSAVDAGLADSVGTAAAATNTFDLSIFRNHPGKTAPEREQKQEPVRVQRDWRVDARHAVAAAQLMR